MKLLAGLALLLLLGLQSALVLINAPSPASGSTVTGSTAIFNWTGTTALCTNSFLSINLSGAPFANISTGSCNGLVTLANLTPGAYNWTVQTVAPIPEETPTQNFTDVPDINVTITYPPNNSVYGPGQCWLLTTVELNDTGGPSASRSVSCSLYAYNGTTWLLNQTSTLPGNGSLNFSNLTTSGQYAVNCTATVAGTSANSSTSDLTTVGASFCAGGADDLLPGLRMTALLILGFSFMWIGIEGKDEPKEELDAQPRQAGRRGGTDV